MVTCRPNERRQTHVSARISSPKILARLFLTVTFFLLFRSFKKGPRGTASPGADYPCMAAAGLIHQVFGGRPAQTRRVNGRAGDAEERA